MFSADSRRQFRLMKVLFLGAVLIVASDLRAQTATQPVGTLACITEPASQTANADTTLSCEFDAIAGPDARFLARVVRRNSSDVIGKQVFIWTVLAPRDGLDVNRLEGRYTGITGGKNAILSKDAGNIVLKPSTGASQLGNNPSPSVLSLELEPWRT